MSERALEERKTVFGMTEEQFQALPKGEPDFLLDSAKIQARVNEQAKNPVRPDICSFTIPNDASISYCESRMSEAIGQWIAWKAKEDWSLDSDVRRIGRFPARDIETGTVILGRSEFRYWARFRYAGPTPKALRIPLNPATVRQAPDHRLTLKEAMRAWNINLAKLERSA